ncbi:WGR domain-containing protein [Microvirga arabica]|uniref:WGR domain-containing protein n=1 Tax=Microvirga arabica TaxID=1128671 RepID=A0ABV6Y620_9HYPH
MAQDTIQYLVLHRCDPSCNMARYYVLSIEPSLFGDATLIREWGRIGRPGQRRVELYENQSCAVEVLETWLQRKQRRGYLLRGGEGQKSGELWITACYGLNPLRVEAFCSS